MFAESDPSDGQTGSFEGTLPLQGEVAQPCLSRLDHRLRSFLWPEPASVPEGRRSLGDNGAVDQGPRSVETSAVRFRTASALKDVHWDEHRFHGRG